MSDSIDIPTYRHPPIIEAVIGITFDDKLQESVLDALSKKLSKEYPHHQPQKNFNFEVNINVDAQSENLANTNVTAEPGHRLSSDDQTEIAILQQNVLLLSQLAPYRGWQSFFSRFESAWKLLKRESGYRPIKFIGLRYINRIDIPLAAATDAVSPVDYLNIYPTIPSSIGQMSAYAVQSEIEIVDLRCQLKINSAVVPSPLVGNLSILIDLDLIRQVDVPQKDDDVFALLQQMRARKNEIFESCVNERARALFNHAQ